MRKFETTLRVYNESIGLSQLAADYLVPVLNLSGERTEELINNLDETVNSFKSDNDLSEEVFNTITSFNKYTPTMDYFDNEEDFNLAMRDPFFLSEVLRFKNEFLTKEENEYLENLDAKLIGIHVEAWKVFFDEEEE